MYNNIYNKNIVTLQFRSTASVVCNCKIKYIMPTYCFAILRSSPEQHSSEGEYLLHTLFLSHCGSGALIIMYCKKTIGILTAYHTHTHTPKAKVTGMKFKYW